MKVSSAKKAAAWCAYLESHARRSYGLLADEGLRAALSLTNKLQEGKLPDNFTVRDVRRNQWRHLTTDESVRAAVDWLTRVLEVLDKNTRKLTYFVRIF